MKTITRSLAALAACALLAACGGGGGAKTSALPAAGSPATTAPGTQQPTSGARLTFTINRSAPKRSKSSVRHAAGKRSAKYFSYAAQGLQITATSGTASSTLYDDIGVNSPICAPADQYDSISTCTVYVPALGQTENIRVIEVDQQPTGENSATGLGTAFPSNSAVLAVGNVTSVALTSGAVTDVSISVNPVAATFADDCGNFLTNNNYDYESNTTSIGFDGNPTYDAYRGDHRIVVTANLPQNVQLALDAAADIYGDCIGTYHSGTQPFVDVDSTTHAVTAVSSSSAITIEPQLYNGYSLAPPAGAVYGPTASFPDSSYSGYGNLFIGFKYDGSNVATATGGPTTSTIVFNNNLSATLPTFTGPPSGEIAPPATYAATDTYTVVPLDVYPNTLGAAGGTVTVYDAAAPGTSPLSVVPATTANSTSCVNGDGSASHATVTPGVYANGMEQFVVSAANSYCSFAVQDNETGVITQTVTVYGGG
jgi:hypothetical protein